MNESKFRRILREEARRALQEMPYAGHLGTASDGFEDDPEGFENVSFFAGEAGGSNRKGAEKFARSGRFKKLAEKHLAHVPGNVWIAPLIGMGTAAGVDEFPSDTGNENRVRLTPLVPDGVELLEKLGYESPARVSRDDTVILYSSMLVENETLATPWMIFHAMLDGGNSVKRISPLFAELSSMFDHDTDPHPEFEAITGDLQGEEGLVWLGGLTMASARNGMIGTQRDALAEIVCQELLTSGGFRINDAGADEEYVEALHALKPYIRQIADEIRRNIKGKLVAVAVN